MCRLFAGFVVAVFFAACRVSPDVVVVDTTGAPVVGAKVEPVTASMNGEVVLTDGKGEARMGNYVQEILWLRVRKEGFAAQESVDFTKPKPIRVVLKP